MDTETLEMDAQLHRKYYFVTGLCHDEGVVHCT